MVVAYEAMGFLEIVYPRMGYENQHHHQLGDKSVDPEEGYRLEMYDILRLEKQS